MVGSRFSSLWVESNFHSTFVDFAEIGWEATSSLAKPTHGRLVEVIYTAAFEHVSRRRFFVLSGAALNLTSLLERQFSTRPFILLFFLVWGIVGFASPQG